MFIPNANDVGKFLDGFNGLGALFAMQSISAGEKIKVFVNGDVAVSGKGVRHITDGAPGQFRFFTHRDAIEQDIAGGWFLDGGDDAHRSGFTGTVGADKPEDMAGIKGK